MGVEGCDPGKVALDILRNGLDDWIHVAEIADLARQSGVKTDTDLLTFCIGLVTRLIVDGYIVPGTVGDGFTPWQGSKSDWVFRIATEWLHEGVASTYPGDIAWFDLTSLGADRATEAESGESR